MANVRNANTIYIDTASSAISVPGLKISYVVLTPTSANAVLVLQDSATSANKVDLRAATSGVSVVFDFSETPLVFPNGIVASTLTNCTATCVITESRA